MFFNVKLLLIIMIEIYLNLEIMIFIRFFTFCCSLSWLNKKICWTQREVGLPGLQVFSVSESAYQHKHTRLYIHTDCLLLVLFAVDRSATTGPVNAGCTLMTASVCTGCSPLSSPSFSTEPLTWTTYPTPDGLDLKQDFSLPESQENTVSGNTSLVFTSVCRTSCWFCR